eukprot:Lithocolla_globosa_v1_NODE_4686_length_1386_cov_86.203606.p2 type:complete len:100 gc:universal NODE_4686_length_1386_cov_86.203606:5-304(+)
MHPFQQKDFGLAREESRNQMQDRLHLQLTIFPSGDRWFPTQRPNWSSQKQENHEFHQLLVLRRNGNGNHYRQPPVDSTQSNVFESKTNLGFHSALDEKS